MTTLTIYTEKYDLNENVVNNGMSGRAFLDVNDKTGTTFEKIDDALNYICTNCIPVHRVEFNYVNEKGVQMFKKFEVFG